MDRLEIAYRLGRERGAREQRKAYIGRPRGIRPIEPQAFMAMGGDWWERFERGYHDAADEERKNAEFWWEATR